MSNSIKYSTGSETQAVKMGNFFIGTGDVGKGPTSTTGYYNGITPPSGGYTLYLNKASGGPSIYVANNDGELISLTNQIAGTSYTTISECLNYFRGQSDKLCLNRDVENIVTENLILNVDAGLVSSYPRNGSTFYNLTDVNVNGTAYNGPSFSTSNGGYFSFDGSDDVITLSTGINSYGLIDTSYSVDAWIYLSAVNRVNGIIGDHQYGWWGFYVESNNKVTLRQTGYASGVQTPINQLSTSSALSVNTWYHVAGVFDITSGIRLYINGSLDNQNSDTNAEGLGPPYYGTGRGPQYIGQYRPGNPNSPNVLNGRISIVRVYANKALSDGEVLQNYNAQKGRYGL
jgi:hypothetical protein